MFISKAEIEYFRALQKASFSLCQFSVLLGENDVGKTSFLHALDLFFQDEKVESEDDFFKGDTKKNIVIALTFNDLPKSTTLGNAQRKDGSVTIKKTFAFKKDPSSKIVLESGKEIPLDDKISREFFSSQNFHLIPVRRDLAVQFSMNKTALLGKVVRATMKKILGEDGTKKCLDDLQRILSGSLRVPEQELQKFLCEQMHNEKIKLKFDGLVIDPLEGIKFDVRISDERVEDILAKNRGAGTQNNLIIALFRLIAKAHVTNQLIFAMEEPENSLHPKAQRQLLSVLQEISKESQVIVTTHSPVFIERSKFESNVILNRTMKGNTVAKTFNPSLAAELKRDLGIRPSDALLKGGGNCALLVEGNTEEDGFPIFMEILGMSEFQLGISIVNMRGSDKDRLLNAARLLEAVS